MFGTAVLLLVISGIGGAQAALAYYSQVYSARVQMHNIGVTLQENGKDIAWRDYHSEKADGTWKEATGVLLQNIAPEGESVVLGKAYTEELTVKNSGTIDQYVRVNIYKYWVDKDGNKVQSLSPDLIGLHLLDGQNGWLLDRTASTSERTVLYYDQILKSGATTPKFSDTLTVDGVTASKVTQRTEPNENGGTTIYTTYDYDGVQFAIEAEVDAVQTHNAADAIWSAWGRRVSVSDSGQLTLQ